MHASLQHFFRIRRYLHHLAGVFFNPTMFIRIWSNEWSLKEKEIRKVICVQQFATGHRLIRSTHNHLRHLYYASPGHVFSKLVQIFSGNPWPLNFRPYCDFAAPTTIVRHLCDDEPMRIRLWWRVYPFQPNKMIWSKLLMLDFVHTVTPKGRISGPTHIYTLWVNFFLGPVW
jgi:hypothetical protein